MSRSRPIRGALIEPNLQEMVIEFDGRPVEYQFGELDEIALAYAISIHKSQGSEYPAIVIPMMMQHYMMLRRNLLYTGITRGKNMVVLVGQKKAIGMAVKGRVQCFLDLTPFRMCRCSAR